MKSSHQSVKSLTSGAPTLLREGYRRITALLKRDGWQVGKDRVERIWRREGLKVPQKQKPRGRLWLNDGSCVRLRPERRNHVWSYDFVSAKTHIGRTVRMLNLIDEHSRECLMVCGWRRRGGKAQEEGYPHPEQGGGRAERRSAQAKRGRLGRPLALRQGRALSQGLVSLFVRVSAQDFQGRVAAGTGRWGGKRRTQQRSQRGRRLPPGSVDS
jgi:hypothetical protein